MNSRSGGLLADVTYELICDPAEVSRSDERIRIIRTIADQMGISPEDAGEALWRFEHCTTSAGQDLN
jgi:hypothetical protein